MGHVPRTVTNTLAHKVLQVWCVCVILFRYFTFFNSTTIQQQIPYFNPTYTRTGWIGQPPILDRHEVVTIDGDVVILRQATP